MMDLPQHPPGEHPPEEALEPRPARSRRFYLGLVIVIVAVAMIVLHLSGVVGPGTN